MIQFNVSVQDETSQAAFQRGSKNVEQVRQVLRANGIDPKAANIGFLSVQPVYEWKPKQKVIGYRVTTDVTLKLKDFTKVAPITQQLADANVSETQTLSYTLENMDEAKNKAVEDAYRRARNSADTLARVGWPKPGRTLLCLGGHVRESAAYHAANGSSHGRDGQCGARSNRGIHATDCDGHGSCECAIQPEIDLRVRSPFGDNRRRLSPHDSHQL